MTTIYITPPAVPCEVSAEQVVAYLLRTGWTAMAFPAPNMFRPFVRGEHACGVPRFDGYSYFGRLLTATILDIARAESRPALDVLADILGPAVGTAGVETNNSIAHEDRWYCGECEFVPPRECAGTSPTPGEVYWAEAPSAPEEE